MYVDQKGVSEKSLEFGLSTFYALIMYGMYLTYIIQITVLEMVGYTRRESDERRRYKRKFETDLESKLIL